MVWWGNSDVISFCRSQREREFLSKITEQFLQVLDSIPAEGEPVLMCSKIIL